MNNDDLDSCIASAFVWPIVLKDTVTLVALVVDKGN